MKRKNKENDAIKKHQSKRMEVLNLINFMSLERIK